MRQKKYSIKNWKHNVRVKPAPSGQNVYTCHLNHYTTKDFQIWSLVNLSGALLLCAPRGFQAPSASGALAPLWTQVGQRHPWVIVSVSTPAEWADLIGGLHYHWGLSCGSTVEGWGLRVEGSIEKCVFLLENVLVGNKRMRSKLLGPQSQGCYKALKSHTN